MEVKLGTHMAAECVDGNRVEKLELASSSNEERTHSTLGSTDQQRRGVMSFLRKASTSTLRNLRPRAAQSEGSFFGEGARSDKNGLIFGETPPPPGTKRKWESWEAPWYVSQI